MKEEELFELAKKLNINEQALKNQYKEDKIKADKTVAEAAKFMGFIKK